MNPNPVTRRRALAATAAAVALPILHPRRAEPAAGTPDAGSAGAGLTLGVSTLGFGELTNAELAAELARAGLRVVQLFFAQKDSKSWKYNGRTDLAGITPERTRAIAAAYRSAGIEIHSLGVYTNLIHPDPAERDANLAYFEEMMRRARQMGVSRLVTEAGHYHPETGPAPRSALHFQEAVWGEMVATGRRLAEMAERHGATVLFEPAHTGFLASAKRTRLYLEEIGSARVRALLDPANLLEVNDLEEMFAQLDPWIDALHAKDRKHHVERGVAAGLGDLDYRKFVTLAAQHTPKAPMLLEYVGSKDYQAALAHLTGAMAKAGVRRG